jgi:hypothetical protein
MNYKDYDKLLQRVFSESNYKKVKEFLDREPHSSDFAITNSNTGHTAIRQRKVESKVPR